MNLLADFKMNQICKDIALGYDKEPICFGDLDLLSMSLRDLNCQILSQKVLVCTLSHEPAERFKLALHGYNIWIR